MATPKATKPVARKTAPVAKKRAPSKVVPKAVISAKAARVMVKPSSQKALPPKTKEGASKADIARDIYSKMKSASRQEILKAFMEQARLSKAGASTYLANIKKQAAQK